MKRFLLLLAILVPIVSQAASATDKLTKSRIKACISDFSSCEGVEVVHLGRFATGAIKGAASVAALGDSDVREALGLMKGIKSISIFDYGSCSEADKEAIAARLDGILTDGEVLMEAKDGDDKVKIIGVIDDKSGVIHDYVLYAPNDCALICIFGNKQNEKLVHIVDND